ncbi:MAG: hypothetical protein KGP14_11535 [Betaproteobacteria bacterium]|nr:hypothetical protein [Betaproteobacteria bacterium]
MIPAPGAITITRHATGRWVIQAHHPNLRQLESWIPEQGDEQRAICAALAKLEGWLAE